MAYSLNFVQICYAYGSDRYMDYFELCPKCEHEIRQIKPYEYPKSGFSKKDYYLLDTYEYGVSDKLKANSPSRELSDKYYFVGTPLSAHGEILLSLLPPTANAATSLTREAQLPHS